jgi:hypothetical protein
MSVLPKFTADYNEKSSNWRVTNDATNKVIATFETKADMTERDALRSALGSAGGSVKIQKMNGRFQEERTYPRDRDPKGSRG